MTMNIFRQMRRREGGGGRGVPQSVVFWAQCPARCSVICLSPLTASGRGDFSLGVNMRSDSIP